MARALEAVHRAGAVHRDLKVHNVMVVDGDPVVIDLRIALVEGIQVGKRELQAWNLCSPGGCAHRAGDRTRAEDLSGARVAAVDSGDHELNAWSLINLAGCRKARRRGGPGRRPLPAGTTVGLAARP
jgi:serine/threonine protein kinase